MQLWLSLVDVLGFKVNVLKSNVCEMYHSTLNNIIDMKSTIFPIIYWSCECVCNIDISQNGDNFWFMKASNFTKWQHASRPESVVSENYYMINLEQTGVAVKCYNQISIGDWYWWFTKPSWYVCIQPATAGYCSFFGITNIQAINYWLLEYKLGLQMSSATTEISKLCILYTHKDSRS